MKDISKLVKKGWSEAMIHQKTLSLILALDDFLVSGPHNTNGSNIEELQKNPNVFIITYANRTDSIVSNSFNKMVSYFIIRPYIRGILYGLNTLYQLSLYIPCDDPRMKITYKKIINKIDVGNQFFHDRIYWNISMIQKDILDRRLACLVGPEKRRSYNKWIDKIKIDCKPFTANANTDLTGNEYLFDLVEIRSFLEEMHQKFFSIISECRNIYFIDIIRKTEVNVKDYRIKHFSYTNALHSYSQTFQYAEKPFMSAQFNKHNKKMVKDSGIKLFKKANRSSSVDNLELALLFEEYESIIQEQVILSKQLNSIESCNVTINKALCRWNAITLRKSDILKILLKQSDKYMISDKLQKLNVKYYERRYNSNTSNSDSDLLSSVKPGKGDSSDSSNYLVISSEKESGEQFPRFTTWYASALKT